MNELHEVYFDDKRYLVTSQCEQAIRFLNSVQETLAQKNQGYRNSVSDPLRVFSDSPADEGLRVRIDDKLSRIRELGFEADAYEDTLLDLVGYLALLAASRVSVGDDNDEKK